jgi:SET domain-containing protein
MCYTNIFLDIFIDPTGEEQGIYYINHADLGDTNAEYVYIEAESSRIVVALATRDITPGEEIFASYSTR